MGYRTDLAIEVAAPYAQKLPPGIQQTERREGNLSISSVEISDNSASEMLGKPQGTYITITAPPLYSAVGVDEDEIEAIAKEIKAMLPDDGLVLVVGLGNNDITPDAIGPRTVHQVLATRHISGDVAAHSGFANLRAAAAIAPGVLGQTGIETSEIIASIVDDIKPGAVIVIDALAARSASRLGTTIQIANSGISPGSGVMNRRKELSLASLGVPVISIGVPTVVDATTLASDLLESDEVDDDKRRELFEPHGQAMMITPREIDVLIGHASKVLALAINKALHPEMSLEEIGYLSS